MFGWIKKLLGIEKEIQEAVTESLKDDLKEVYEADKSKVKQAKKPVTKKKKAAEDLSAMNKTQLLALCKERGVKANASLKKDELIARLSA